MDGGANMTGSCARSHALIVDTDWESEDGCAEAAMACCPSSFFTTGLSSPTAGETVALAGGESVPHLAAGSGASSASGSSNWSSSSLSTASGLDRLEAMSRRRVTWRGCEEEGVGAAG